jgi:glycosyltransferase involved in cell wall biosynthesis
MRILHIISRMDPVGGGPQEVVRLLLRYAPPAYEQEVVTLDDPASAFLHHETATIHALGGSGKGFVTPHLTHWLRANRDRFDGIILHGLWEYASLSILRAIAGHTPYVVFAHGMLDPYFKRASPLKHLKKWLYWLPVQYWTLRRAHRVLFTTTAERDLATQSFWLHNWKPLVVALGAEAPPTDLGVPDASEHEASASETGGPEARSINNAGDSDTFFALCPALRGKSFLLFLGRIDPKKGCDLLIEAFAALKGTGFSPHVEHLPGTRALAPEGTDASAMPDLHLVLAGPDPLNWSKTLDHLARTHGIEDRIHFPGMLRGPAKWGAFAACDAFILPSHQENFGIAVVEALACAKPVLITHPVNISAELAADGAALVEDDTLQGTTNLLTHWIALTPDDKANMAIAARNSFTTRYDMRRNAQDILRCFEECP